MVVRDAELPWSCINTRLVMSDESVFLVSLEWLMYVLYFKKCKALSHWLLLFSFLLA